jgi:DNA-binding NarL/FixJ family response regulator
MNSYEFYATPEGEVMFRQNGQAESQLKETDVEFIDAFLSIISEFYTEAHHALMSAYSRSALNARYRNFLVLRRFIKCNFGVFDNLMDVDELWNFKFEFVQCPLRGECKLEHIVCFPKFNSQLSTRQLEVMKLFTEGVSDSDIAERLFLSIYTVNNHRKNSFKKLGVHSMSEFMRYASTNNLFK